MSLSMQVSKYGGGTPVLRPGMPTAGTTTFGGSGYERFAGPMAYGRGAMMGAAGNGMYGDPGLFGFLGKVVKTGLGVVSKLGIPVVSGAAGIAGGLLGGGFGGRAGPGLPGPVAGARPFRGPMPISLGQAGQIPSPGIVAAGQRAIPGGATGMEGCPQGHRPNKSGYFLRDGTFVAPNTVCVKIRRRNPLNPRALSRSMARIESAKRAADVLKRITIRPKC